MVSEVAFAFKTGMIPGPKAYPAAFGAGSDGSLFWIGYDEGDPALYRADASASGGKKKLQAETYPTTDPNQINTAVIAPVNVSRCYFLRSVASGDVVSVYSALDGITDLPSLPGRTTPVAVSAAGDGTMWAMGADEKPYAYDPASSSWTGLARPHGTLQLISVGSANFVLALVTDNGTNKIMRYADESWQALSGAPSSATWIGACLDGSYWTWCGSSPLLLTTGGKTEVFKIPKQQLFGFAAANRYGCHVYLITSGQQFQTAAFGAIDAPAIAFPSFSGDQQIAYEAINQATDPNGIRDSYANLDAPLNVFNTKIATMLRPSRVKEQDWETVKTQISSELLYAIAVQKLFVNIADLNHNINELHLETYNSVVSMVGLPSEAAKQPSTPVSIILGFVFESLFEKATDAIPQKARKAITAVNLGFDVYKAAADRVAEEHGAPNSNVAFQLACSKLADMLTDTHEKMLKSAGGFETTILTDWGKLSACGQAIVSGLWCWPPSFDYDVFKKIGDSVRINYYQTLMPVKWQIALIQTIYLHAMPSSRPLLPNVPAYTLVYKSEGSPPLHDATYWWWVCMEVGKDATQRTTGPFPNRDLMLDIMHHLEELVKDESEFFTGAKGWALPIVKGGGYEPPPRGLSFLPYDDSASPLRW